MKTVSAAFVAWIFTFAIVASSAFGAESSKQSASDEIADACRRTAESLATIVSGYCEMEISTSGLNCSDAEIQSEIEDRTKAAREALEKETDDKERAVYEDRIKRITASVRDQVKTDRQQLKVTFSDRSSDGVKIRAESLQKNDKTGKWETSSVWLEKQDAKGEQGALTWRPQSKLAYLRSWSGFDEELDFTAFGRMRGDPTSELAMTYGDAVVLKIAGRKTYDKTATATVIETRLGQAAKAKTLQRFWIDTTRGGVCPVVQTYSTDGVLQSEWKSSDYFQNEKSGIWFPGKTVRTTIASGFANSQKTVWQINPTTFRINEKEKKTEFSVTLPPRTRIADYRNKARASSKDKSDKKGKSAGGPRYYVADAALSMSLAPNGFDLSKKSGLQVVDNISRLIPPKRQAGALGALKDWLPFAAVAAVGMIVGVTTIRNRRRRRASTTTPVTETAATDAPATTTEAAS